MAQRLGLLHIVCGKIASGKSSLAARLARAPGAVLLSEDFLLSRLYPGEIASLDDYVRAAGRLRSAVAPHVEALLRLGLEVVLDFQANTPAGRAWARSVAEAAGAELRLHYLRADDETCKARLRARNLAGVHEYQVSDAEFELFTSRFVPPTPDEGLSVILHDQPDAP